MLNGTYVTDPDGVRAIVAHRPHSLLSAPLSLLRAAIHQEESEPGFHLLVDGFLLDGHPSLYIEADDDLPPLSDQFPRPFLHLDHDADETVYQLSANFNLPDTTQQEG